LSLIYFHITFKILFVVHQKCSGFWASADVKPMSNDQVHAMARQCLYDLSMCILRSLC